MPNQWRDTLRKGLSERCRWVIGNLGRLCAIKALVVGANAKLVNGKTVRYDETRVRERSRTIATAIEARAQRYQVGKRFHYKPLAGFEGENSFNEETREQVVKSYSLLDLHS